MFINKSQHDTAKEYYYMAIHQEINHHYTLAVDLYIKAATLGHVIAQYNLGVLYAHGKGVNQSWELAVYWYKMAANQGYKRAQSILGWYYEYGRGVTQDLKQAIHWYQMASEHQESIIVNRLY